MLYLAVSMAARLRLLHRQPWRRRPPAGMSAAMYGELIAIVGMAAETNRLAEALRCPL